jgi:hypothetical protein
VIADSSPGSSSDELEEIRAAWPNLPAWVRKVIIDLVRKSVRKLEG